MSAQEAAPKKKQRDPRTGLRTSATLATIFTILGHTVLGFEQSLAQVFVALITGYSCGLLFEAIDAGANGRPFGFRGGGIKRLVDFLLPAHMTSITIAFLLYSSERLGVMAFTVAAAMGSKYIFRVRIGDRYRHYFNPSNFGLVVALVLFQWTGPIPWGYTVQGGNWVDWALPLAFVVLGSRLNLLFTDRLPLIGSFIVGFLLQGALRAAYTGGPVLPEIVGLTGVAVLLFIFYMITDPVTSPRKVRNQVVFGLGIAASYGLMMVLNVQFSMFFALFLTCAVRGVVLYADDLSKRRHPTEGLLPAPVAQ